VSDHTEAGALLAYADGELPVEERAALSGHLRECLACRRALDEVQGRADAVSGALAALDVPTPLERAWQELCGRLGLAGAPPSRRRSGLHVRGSVARAAGLVLLLSGAAAAAVIPGSPVRAWLFGRADPTEPPSRPAATAEEELGARTEPQNGRIDIVLDVPPGTEIEVALLAGERAGIFAPTGTSFSSASGRLEAHASAGPLRLELPRGVERASVRVNGRAVLVLRRGLVEAAPGGATGDLATEASRMTFRAPGNP